ncbi:hypothetical protein CBR_g31956 [Chara braunii]|uniref:Integrase catalytic domain-containing protein n=1 Tax=Chara braunii TaxID=69332 RepID=A0A388LG65_CHABU|nr:hypothetical protein CBR_g31956 [Chara braunii]|eukprot:GBG81281.1 hypothetical protein CBR_g31956 [Chara braunii]
METGYDFILGTSWSRWFHNTEADWATNTLVLKTKCGQTYRVPFIGTTATPCPDPPPPEPSVPTPSPSITVTSPRQFAHFIRQDDVTFFMVNVTDLLHYDPPCPDVELIPLEPDPPSISMVPISTSHPPPSVESTSPSRADADAAKLARYTADMEPAVRDLIQEYHDIFPSSFSYAGIPLMRDVQHSIQLVPDDRVHHEAPYRLSIPEATELKRQLEELLRRGFIKPINFPWGAPVLFARKADETLRLCIYYRGLNRYTVKNSYLMPHSDELFDRLAGNRFFTKIDLRLGYYQIHVAAADQPKTAFRSRFGHYEFTVMPFGLTKAPATFQRAMNDIFRDILEQYVLVYLDDILVYSHTLEEHLKHLHDVLDRLRRHGFYAKLSKCRFAQHKVDFLGHYVSDQGLHMDDAKIAAFEEWPTPTSAKQLRSFLGLTSYYSNFIRGYARYSYVLTSTLFQKNPPWAWTPLHEDAFRPLKKAVTCTPVLHLPDFDRPFILTTDALDFAVGAVLSHVFPSSPDSSHPRIPRFPPPTPTTGSRLTPTRPATDERSFNHSPTIAEDGTVESHLGDCLIAFYPRQLLPAVINYSADERELRVRAVKEFHDQAAAGHMGFHKTLTRVSRLYVWPKRKDFVKDYVAECPTCQEVNSANHLPYGLLQPLPIPEGHWQSISMDFIGPLRPPTPRGHDAILVVVDRFTKHARFVPCRYAISAREVAGIVFDRVVRDHGLALSIISDCDPDFTIRFWRRLHEVYGSQLRFSSSYHPQTDGQTEITNKTLGDILRKIVRDDQQWDLHLAHAEIAYNHAVSPATGMSPYYCDLGYHPRVSADFLRPSQMHPDTSCPALDDWVAHMTLIMKTAHEHKAASQTRMAARANQSRMDHPFKVGDDVLMDARHLQLEADTLRKFRRRFFGPCHILQAVGSNTASSPVSFRVKLPDYLHQTRVHDVYHVSTSVQRSCRDSQGDEGGGGVLRGAMSGSAGGRRWVDCGHSWGGEGGKVPSGVVSGSGGGWRRVSGREARGRGEGERGVGFSPLSGSDVWEGRGVGGEGGRVGGDIVVDGACATVDIDIVVDEADNGAGVVDRNILFDVEFFEVGTAVVVNVVVDAAICSAVVVDDDIVVDVVTVVHVIGENLPGEDADNASVHCLIITCPRSRPCLKSLRQSFQRGFARCQSTYSSSSCGGPSSNGKITSIIYCTVS